MSPTVQELPILYKPTHHVIANPVRTPGVAISCRNYRLHTTPSPIVRLHKKRKRKLCETQILLKTSKFLLITKIFLFFPVDYLKMLAYTIYINGQDAQ